MVGDPHAASPCEELQVVVSAWVLSGVEPIRMIVHHLEGDWSVVCGTVDDVAHLHGRPLSWLRGRRDVGRFVDELLPGELVTRDGLGDEWVREVAPSGETGSRRPPGQRRPRRRDVRVTTTPPDGGRSAPAA